MNSYYLKIMQASDDIVLKQFYKCREDVRYFPDDENFYRDYNFILSVLIDSGYTEKELIN